MDREEERENSSDKRKFIWHFYVLPLIVLFLVFLAPSLPIGIFAESFSSYSLPARVGIGFLLAGGIYGFFWLIIGLNNLWQKIRQIIHTRSSRRENYDVKADYSDGHWLLNTDNVPDVLHESSIDRMYPLVLSYIYVPEGDGSDLFRDKDDRLGVTYHTPEGKIKTFRMRYSKYDYANLMEFAKAWGLRIVCDDPEIESDMEGSTELKAKYDKIREDIAQRYQS